MSSVSAVGRYSVEIKSSSQSGNKRKKASKGTVVVQVFKERLRLVWSFLGKRYYLYIGLPDSQINQTVAKQKALQIEGDMATGNFDPTLNKYKPEYQKKKENISISKLFQTFMTEKAKGNRARTISLTNKLQIMLLKRRPDNFNPEDLVFTSPEEKSIHDGNFRNRAWKKILISLGIDYRKPYITRHTLISHALETEMNPVDVAQLTGHNVETLYQNYAGVVNSRPRLPEFQILHNQFF